MACYTGIDHFTRRLREARFQETGADTVMDFLVECTRQATDIANGHDSLSNLDRARVLDILLRASELGSRLRRSARRLLEIAVKIQSVKLGNTWEEDSVTRVLSQHGAALRCLHPVENGAIVTVTRLDNGRHARARVAWSRVLDNDGLEIGVEFLESENFWGMNWAESESHSESPQMARFA